MGISIVGQGGGGGVRGRRPSRTAADISRGEGIVGFFLYGLNGLFNGKERLRLKEGCVRPKRFWMGVGYGGGTEFVTHVATFEYSWDQSIF